jgi:DNA-binding winged helix-turn-helix (wHTH) protein
VNVSFRVGEFLIEPRLNNISNGDKSVHVEPKVMHVLTCLTDNPGEVVSKENLIRVVWADTFVTDDVLTCAISELRKVFGDDSKGPRYIQTIPRTGYRLIAPVVKNQDQAQADSTIHVLPVTTFPLRRFIWVVPLCNGGDRSPFLT